MSGVHFMTKPTGAGAFAQSTVVCNEPCHRQHGFDHWVGSSRPRSKVFTAASKSSLPSFSHRKKGRDSFVVGATTEKARHVGTNTFLQSQTPCSRSPSYCTALASGTSAPGLGCTQVDVGSGGFPKGGHVLRKSWSGSKRGQRTCARASKDQWKSDQSPYETLGTWRSPFEKCRLPSPNLFLVQGKS